MVDKVDEMLMNCWQYLNDMLMNCWQNVDEIMLMNCWQNLRYVDELLTKS